MFETVINFFKKMKKQEKEQAKSKDTAKERLHLVLMQDRANVSADFLDLMKQEIIEVIKKYIDVDENEIDVRLTNKDNGDGTNGAPALYANIPIVSIKEDVKSGMARQEENVREQIAKVENEIEPKEEVQKEKRNDIETVEKWNEEVEKRNQEIQNEENIWEDVATTEKNESNFQNSENAEKGINESNFQNHENAERDINESNFQNHENVERDINESNFQNHENVETDINESNFQNNENVERDINESNFQNNENTETDINEGNFQNYENVEKKINVGTDFEDIENEKESEEEEDVQESEERDLLLEGANTAFGQGNLVENNHENDRNMNKKKNKFNKKKRRNRNQRR